MKKFFEITCSGILGVILTLGFQYFLVKPQPFTFIYDGNKVVVTESTYAELLEDNKKMENNIVLLETQIQELENELENRNAKENITLIIKKATEYWNNAEYVQALTLLKNCDLDSSDISILYRDYSEEYCVNILRKVDNLISERKYDEAKELLSESKALVDDSTILEKKLGEINNSLPLKLSNLKISSSRYFELNESKLIEDTVGNKYLSENLFVTRAEGGDGYGYATFYLGEKYKGLSGTIAVSDESENRSDTQLEGWIEIYSKNGDEYSHLYSSPILSRMTSPIDIPEVNISDTDWLEIRCYNNGDYYSLAGGYHSLEILLSDFMLYS